MGQRTLAFIYFVVAFSAIPQALAGPACSKQHYAQPGCVALCNARWGWSGKMMGTDSWGSVMHKVDDSSEDVWNDIIAKACGLASSTPSSSVSTQLEQSFTTTASQTFVPSVSVIPSSINSQASPSPTTHVIFSASSKTSMSLAETLKTTSTSTHLALPSTTQKAAEPITSVKVASTTAKPSSTVVVKPPPTTSPVVSKESASTESNASSAGGNTDGSANADIQAYLTAHNSFRAQHGAAALTWSDEAASKAQQWANGCDFKHSGGSLGPFGENLAAGNGADYDITAAIKSWTDESKTYDPSNPTFSHFTQVVWKSTTQVGCAESVCGTLNGAGFGNAKYFVCEYSPAGNIIGEFQNNVQA